MPAISSFENIEAWQDARRLAKDTYQSCRKQPLARDYGLKDQIQRAAVSVMANIAEGFGRGRNTEFTHYLKIARGSCTELQSHLYVALDAELIDEATFTALQSQAMKTGKRISAFISYLQQAQKP